WGRTTSRPVSAAGSNGCISGLPEGRARDLQRHRELALGVVAGHEQLVALVDLVVREAVGVHPAVLELEPDAVRPLAAYGAARVVDDRVAHEGDHRRPLLG